MTNDHEQSLRKHLLELLDGWISARQVRRRHQRLAAEVARRKAGEFSAFSVDAAGALAPGAVGHS